MKVALDNPHGILQLGSTVSSAALLDAPEGIEVPSSPSFRAERPERGLGWRTRS